MTDYEIYTLIINIFIALGTCGAVIVSLWMSRPKKERAAGTVSFNFQKKPFVQFNITNKGKENIIFNYNAGILLKSTGKSEIIELNNTRDNGVFIPRKSQKSFLYYLNLTGDGVKMLYGDKNCRFYVYTLSGSPIELKRENKE